MKRIGFLLCGFSAALLLSLVSASIGIVMNGAPYASVLVPLTTWALPLVAIFAAAYVMAVPSMRGVAALHFMALAAIAGAVLWPIYAHAQEASGTTVNAGDLFSGVRGPIEYGVGLVVAAILGWLSLLVKNNIGLSIDGKMRDSLQNALLNGLHLGLDEVQSRADATTIDVKSVLVAKAIAYVREYSSDAVKHFKLGDVDLEQMAKAKLPQVLPAEVAAAVAGAAKPAGA
ncbi:hypothetical protein [Methylobacterium radiotolerans]|uniref:hypothetical protein n=1 Tax=Methylobacterium radiotolerans TaxID=31998 RepID=UPI001F3E6FAE|nr:hypothetical protein [Methylobacterium radiotolerans]UIY44121.1 hypothetical protein LZ599_10720 [Methylobacterium radiotolerans]